MRVYGLKHGAPQEPGFLADGSYVPNPYYMQEAIRWATHYREQGQHPVGAVVTRTMLMWNIDAKEERVYEFLAGTGVQEVVNNSSLHAEVVALQKAEHYNGRRKLQELHSVLYTTHEPCPMCAGYIANSKISGIVYGTSAQDASDLVRNEGIKWRSNAVSGLDVIRGRMEPGMPEQFIIGGFMRDECLDLLRTAGDLAIGRRSTA